jgi:hypothetical protein
MSHSQFHHGSIIETSMTIGRVNPREQNSHNQMWDVKKLSPEQASAGTEATDGFLGSSSDRICGLANDSEPIPLAFEGFSQARATQPSRRSEHADPSTQFDYTSELYINTSDPSLPICSRMHRGPSPLVLGFDCKSDRDRHPKNAM